MIKVVILLEQLFRNSRLCRVSNLRKRPQTIPCYVDSKIILFRFQAMLWVKMLEINSILCILCRIWKRFKLIPDYVFHAMSCVKSWKIFFRFQTMYSMLCRWWNLFIFNSRLCRVENLRAPIPDYVFHAMSCVKSLSNSRLCIPCYRHSEISHFSIPDYVELLIPCYCFPDYGMASLVYVHTNKGKNGRSNEIKVSIKITIIIIIRKFS
jgi:hypothetical protein